MALITCAECQGQVSTEAETCPHCGYPLRNEEKPNNLADFTENQNWEIIDGDLEKVLYDTEAVYQEAKICQKRSCIKLITPILWLIVPTVLLMLFTDYSFASAFVMGLIVVCCAFVAAPLFRFGKDNVQYEVTHYIGFDSYTTDSNGGWLGIVIGVVAVIASMLFLSNMAETWWPDYPFMPSLILNVEVFILCLVPYTKRWIDFFYYRRIVIATKDKPNKDTLMLRAESIEKRRKRDIITATIIFASIIVAVVILGVILAYV